MNSISVVLVFCLMSLLPSTCLGGPASPTPVEVWTGGDDGLTQRLSDGIRSAFENTHDFVLSTGHKPGTVYVDIVTNVRPKTVGSRIQLAVQIEVTKSPPDEKKGFDLNGSSEAYLTCWEDDLKSCAKTVEKFALRAR